jgi:hypothetical protein
MGTEQSLDAIILEARASLLRVTPDLAKGALHNKLQSIGHRLLREQGQVHAKDLVAAVDVAAMPRVAISPAPSKGDYREKQQVVTAVVHEACEELLLQTPDLAKGALHSELQRVSHRLMKEQGTVSMEDLVKAVDVTGLPRVEARTETVATGANADLLTNANYFADYIQAQRGLSPKDRGDVCRKAYRALMENPGSTYAELSATCLDPQTPVQQSMEM